MLSLEATDQWKSYRAFLCRLSVLSRSPSDGLGKQRSVRTKQGISSATQRMGARETSNGDVRGGLEVEVDQKIAQGEARRASRIRGGKELE